MGSLALVAAVSGAAGLMSVMGGWLALHRRPTSLFLSLALGLAGGVLLGAIAFEMIPTARELSSPVIVAGGFAVGVGAVHAFQMAVNRGRTAGIHAAQRRQIRHYHALHPPVGDEVTVLAGGTAAEELIEGLSIGALVAEKDGGGKRSPAARRRVLLWTGGIGGALFGSSVLSWLTLR